MKVDIIVLLIGVAFFATGIAFFLKYIKGVNKYTMPMTAKVVDYVEEIHHRARSGTSVAYFPVMGFTIDGKYYEKKYDIGKGWKDYEIGSEVKIMYNPENPEEYSIIGDKSKLIASFIAMAIGIFVMLIGFGII